MLLSGAQHFGTDAATLICMIKLEEYQFVMWAQNSGLADDALDPRLDQELIRETLAKLWDLLSDTKLLEKRYKLDLAPVSDSSIVLPAVPSPASIRFLVTTKIIRKREVIMRRAKQFKKYHSFRGECSRQLINLIAILHTKNMQSDLRDMQLKLIGVTDKLDDIPSSKVRFRRWLTHNPRFL
jgi:hypothetical protein